MLLAASSAWRFAKDHWIFFCILIGIIVLRATVVDWHPLPSGSMHPTLLEGDVLVVNRLSYDVKFPFTNHILWHLQNPARGDIVVFDEPQEGRLLVKRIIGIPGDTVSLVNKALILNGHRAQYQPYGPAMDYIPVGAHWSAHDFVEIVPGLPAHKIRRLDNEFPSDFATVTVPPGHYLMLGDNRDNSADFRFFGFVSEALLQGRVARVAFSEGSEITPGFGRDRLWRAP